MWRMDDPQGNESAKVKYDVVRYTRGRGLDLGCGPSKAFPHFIGVDNYKDTELFGIEMRPDVVSDVTDLSIFGHACMDFVFSSHTLEHIEDHKKALAEWWRVLKVGGHLILYLPHKQFYPNIGKPGSNPDHKHDFLPSAILAAMSSIGTWEVLVDEERNDGQEYSFLQVYRKTEGGECRVKAYARPEKTACVCRFGGFGDQIQAANILPELKRQGYHVTFMTTPKGQDILLHDPHIDDWIIQDPDQVPNAELGAYWEATAKRFDKFVNLSESVEGTLLAMPGRANHAWPQPVRHAVLNANYLEFTSTLAQLPYRSEAKFYPSDDEIVWSQAFRDGFAKDEFLLMWALSGSSVHKFTPHQDTVMHRVLKELPRAHIVLAGDYACKILEGGWKDGRRVRLTSGELSIRQTLALALASDCVVGPETGVLNAVAFEPMGKVVFLSHSSRENLTLHWRNTQSIFPDAADVPCYPCHQLHYAPARYCSLDEATGAAMCQVKVTPEEILSAIKMQYDAWAVR